ncbi:hypothetical protein [Streptomyces mirabilis]|uniref:hypothetical protein n=1 Tax=Streptomyces mirabilis TaxID=68239 RepID=UPI0033BA5B9D
MTDWRTPGHYETDGGDRVTLLMRGNEWAIAWSYGWPHCGLQVVPYGESGPEAIEAFQTSREGKTLVFDSREAWQNGSV